MNWLGNALAVLVVLTLLLSLLVVRRLEGGDRAWMGVLRARLLWGVPWGTLMVVGFVLAIYLFVQDGITDFDDPVVKPFRAWSYFYPLGMLTSSFSHAHTSHLTGNLIGTVVVAPIAEYAWGHYPGTRAEQSRHTWLRTPWIRAFVLFPSAVIALGLMTSLFALGPVIGFSGVVFAFAGFAIVRYPVATLVATIGVQGVVSRIFNALQTPIGVYVAQPQGPSPTSWATIAIQGHALGFFLGLLLAIVVFRRRSFRPNPLYLWLAVLLYGFSKSLWAIYWFGGANRYILLQGPGVIAVIALAAVIVVAVAGSDRSIVPAPLERRFSRPTAPFLAEGALLTRVLDRRRDRSPPGATEGVDAVRPRWLPSFLRSGDPDPPTADDADHVRLERVAELVSRPSSRLPSVLTNASRRYTALLVVLIVLAAISGPAIPVNLFVLAADDATTGETAVEIEDYTITYAEDVDNPIASVVGLEEFDPGGLEASGVIVSSADRQLWTEAVSDQQLAFSGSSTITVGGPGWRDTVTVEREGWTPVGGETVYQIWLESESGDGDGTEDDRSLAYTANASQAQAQIDGYNVTIAAEDGTFLLEVEPGTDGLDVTDRTGADVGEGEPADEGDPDDTDAVSEADPATGETVEMPAANESVTVGDLEFVRVDDELFVTTGETTIQIASKETYN